MAQRVYLIPIRSEVTGIILNWLRSSPESQPTAWSAVLSRAEPLQRVRWIGETEYRPGVEEHGLESENRRGEHDLSVHLRPLMVTSPHRTDAVNAIRALRQLKSDGEIRSAYDREVERIKPHWAPPSRDPEGSSYESERDELFNEFPEKLEDLRTKRAAALAGRPAQIQVMDTVEVAGMKMLSMDRTHVEELPAAEVPANYGAKLGQLFAGLSSCCEPAWFCGRSYWLSGLARVELSWFSRLFSGSFQRRLAEFGTSPVSLLQDVAVPGFEAGFDLQCPAYCTGTYFRPEEVGPMREWLLEKRSTWTDLGQTVTGYPRGELGLLERSILEALEYAELEGCGLLEGDDLGLGVG